MQDCLRRFARRKQPLKWTEQEREKLRRTVEQVCPRTNEDWRLVCVRMHQLQSRRVLREYKSRGINFLPDSQRQQIKLTPECFEEIFTRFERGTPVKTLVALYAKTFENQVCIRNRITQRFEAIKRTVRRIVGISKTRALTARDYELFAFVRAEKLQLPSLVQILDHCNRLRLIGKAKNEAEKQEVRDIEQQLERYNSLLWQYTELFNQHKANQPKGQARKKNDPIDGPVTDKPQTVPIRHLALVTKDLLSSKTQEIVPEGDNFLQQWSEKNLGTQMTIPSMKTMGENEWDFDNYSGYCMQDEREYEFSEYPYCDAFQHPTTI